MSLRAFFAAAVLLSAAAAQPKPDYSRDAARPAPKWVESGVVYEIYTRSFSEKSNFAGITAQLDRLKKLGVTVLWIMPVHPVGQVKKKGTLGSPYSVRDHYAIDPSYGTRADLMQLVAQAHQRGLKVVLDMVLNHSAWDSVLMKHPDYYLKDANGRIIPPNPDWQDVAGLDYSNRELRRYMVDMLSWWVREFDFDGFRCDVAFGPPTDFWEQARAELEKLKPEIGMLAEASKPDLLLKAFDFDYAWPFHAALTEVVENGKPAREIQAVWRQERREFPRGALHMRFSDNHDEKRAIARFGERGALAASALVFSMDGVPMLYNGMEAGDTTESGGPALFEPLHVFWPIQERRKDFPAFYQALAALRREHAALQQGETRWVRNSDPDRVVSFLRRGADEEFLCLVNLSNRPFDGRVTLDSVAGFTEIAVPPAKAVQASLPAVELDAWGWRFYRREVR